MAYSKTNWVNGYTPLNASNMNKIEEGIFNNDTFLSSLDIRVNTLEGKIGQGGIGSVVVNGNGNAITNASYDTSTKILNFERNNTFALDSDNKKSIYHLGAYDSISGNVITRQTGYIKLNGSESGWNSYNAGFWAYITINDITPTSSQTELGQFVVSRGNVVTLRTMINTSSGIQISLDNTSLNIRPNVSDVNTIDAFKSWLSQNQIVIQYKLATPYTEEIIEGQPLNTLDQSGSQWVRKEWEKGLNLLPSDYVEYNSDNTRLKQNVYLNVGIYTISFSNITMSVGSWQVILNGSPIATYSLTQNAITFIVSSDNTVFQFYANQQMLNAKFILNEGSHAYPYHVYQGGIAREYQLVQRKLFSARDSTMDDVKSFVNNNHYRIISIMYFADSERYSKGRSVIYNADEGSYFYINSDHTFSDVQLNSNATQNRYDYIYIHYHKY